MSNKLTNQKIVSTSPNHPTIKITANTYIVTVGFEVNVETAFVMKVYSEYSQSHYSYHRIPTITREMTQILNGPGSDYGHAFFMLLSITW